MAVRFISVILLYQRLLHCARHYIRRLNERCWRSKQSSYPLTESEINVELYDDLRDSFSPLILRWNWKIGRWTCRRLECIIRADWSVEGPNMLTPEDEMPVGLQISVKRNGPLLHRSSKVFELTGRTVTHKVCTEPVYWDADYAGWH